MAPVPPEEDHPHQDNVPPLHLRAFDLGHAGALRVLSHPVPLPTLLKSCILKVLDGLYPPGVKLPLPKRSGYGVQYISDPPSDPSDTESDSDDEDEPGPPPVRSVTFYLEDFDGVAFTCGSKLDEEHKEVHLSLGYMEGVEGDSARIAHELEGILVHELIHAFQYDGDSSVPGGVIEGIADYVRLKNNLGPPHWSEEAERWDQGYEKTGYFFDWIAGHINKPHFVAELNWAFNKRGWADGHTLRDVIGGRDVEELWKVYKRYLEHKNPRGSKTGAQVAIPTHGPRA